MLAEKDFVARDSKLRENLEIHYLFVCVCPFKAVVLHSAQFQLLIFIINDSTDSDVSNLDHCIHDLTSKWSDGHSATGPLMQIIFGILLQQASRQDIVAGADKHFPMSGRDCFRAWTPHFAMCTSSTLWHQRLKGILRRPLLSQFTCNAWC